MLEGIPASDGKFAFIALDIGGCDLPTPSRDKRVFGEVVILHHGPCALALCDQHLPRVSLVGFLARRQEQSPRDPFLHMYRRKKKTVWGLRREA